MEDMRMSGCREGVASKSNPAGATPSLTRSTIQGQAPGIARPAERLSIPTARGECLATARSNVEVANTNTIMMIQEVPKTRSTIQGQAPGIARPAEKLSIPTAMVECLATARSNVELTNTIMMTQELPETRSTIQGQAAGIARPAEGLSIPTATVEELASARSTVEVTNIKKEHSLKPSQAELTRTKLAKQIGDQRLQRMSSSRNLAQAPIDPEPSPRTNPKVTQLVSRFETVPSPIKMPRPPR
jgi:DNA uptake protein ComE-like DNA-binding protein